MKTKSGGMTVISCDVIAGCVERFLSASDPAIVEYQACLAGWIVRKTRPVSPHVHACPKHKAGLIAAEVKNPFAPRDR
jgi:hypothetical protein